MNTRIPLVVGFLDGESSNESAQETLKKAFATVVQDLVARYPHTPLEVRILDGSTSQTIIEEAALRLKFHSSTFQGELPPCHLLVCFWDGKLGAVAGHVERHLSGKGRDEFGQAVHIWSTSGRPARAVDCYCPEEGALYSTLYAPSWATQSEEGGVRDYFAENLLRLDHFNDLSGRAEAARVKSCQDSLFPPQGLDLLSVDLRNVLQVAATADALAQGLQRKVRGTTKWLFTLVVIGFTVYSLFSYLYPSTLLFLTLPALLLIGWGLNKWAERKAWHNDFTDYRALAESLRVQVYWVLSGLDGNVVDHYSSKVRASLGWLLPTLRVITWKSTAQQTDSLQRLRSAVLEGWVFDQRNYYLRTSKKRYGQLRQQSSLTAAFFAAALLCFVGIGGLQLWQSWLSDIGNWNNFKLAQGTTAYLWLSVALDAFLGIGAALASFTEVTGRDEEEKQYRRLKRLFVVAANDLASLRPEQNSEFQRIIADLGREALAENGDWLVTQKDYPLELPIA